MAKKKPAVEPLKRIVPSLYNTMRRTENDLRTIRENATLEAEENGITLEPFYEQLFSELETIGKQIWKMCDSLELDRTGRWRTLRRRRTGKLVFALSNMKLGRAFVVALPYAAETVWQPSGVPANLIHSLDQLGENMAKAKTAAKKPAKKAEPEKREPTILGRSQPHDYLRLSMFRIARELQTLRADLSTLAKQRDQQLGLWYGEVLTKLENWGEEMAVDAGHLPPLYWEGTQEEYDEDDEDDKDD